MEIHLDKKMEWDIIEKPIEVPGSDTSAFKALVRSDNQSVISVMSSSYVTFRNQEFMKLTTELARLSGMVVKGFADFNGGKRVMGYLESKENAKVVDDELKEYMVLGNSHDGTNKLFVANASKIFRCENMFSHKLRSFEVKHNKAIQFEVHELKTFIAAYHTGRSEVHNMLANFASINVSQSVIDEFINQVLELDKLKMPEQSKRKPALQSAINREMKSLGSNLWGLYNGLTYFTTHMIKTDKHTLGNVSGTAQQLNHLGYQLCLEVSRRNIINP